MTAHARRDASPPAPGGDPWALSWPRLRTARRWSRSRRRRAASRPATPPPPPGQADSGGRQRGGSLERRTGDHGSASEIASWHKHRNLSVLSQRPSSSPTHLGRGDALQDQLRHAVAALDWRTQKQTGRGRGKGAALRERGSQQRSAGRQAHAAAQGSATSGCFLSPGGLTHKGRVRVVEKHHAHLCRQGGQGKRQAGTEVRQPEPACSWPVP